MKSTMTTDSSMKLTAASTTKSGSRGPRQGLMEFGLMLINSSWLALAALFFVAGAPTTASAANSCVKPGGIVDTNCTLDANYVGTITVTKSQVTLDCREFRIAGPATATSPIKPNAINIVNVRDVTVKSCLIQNGGNGINIDRSRYVNLLNVRVRNNWGAGVKINQSADVSILNSDVSRNLDDGVELDNSYNIIIRDTTVTRNYDEGIDSDNSDNLSFFHVIVDENGVNTDKGGDGIGLTNSSYVSIRFCDLTDNRKFGVDIKGGYMVTIQNNTFQGNKGTDGEMFGAFRRDATVRSLDISSNTFF
jgi:parallel beta-helix repeat protein